MDTTAADKATGEDTRAARWDDEDASPPEPPCIDDAPHEWRQPKWLDGDDPARHPGLATERDAESDEILEITSQDVCVRCGAYRFTSLTRAPEESREDIWEYVEYNDADERSARWAERGGAEEPDSDSLSAGDIALAAVVIATGLLLLALLITLFAAYTLFLAIAIPALVVLLILFILLGAGAAFG